MVDKMDFALLQLNCSILSLSFPYSLLLFLLLPLLLLFFLCTDVKQTYLLTLT